MGRKTNRRIRGVAGCIWYINQVDFHIMDPCNPPLSTPHSPLFQPWPYVCPYSLPIDLLPSLSFKNVNAFLNSQMHTAHIVLQPI